MPVIDFTCSAGHRIEHFYHQTESKTVTECLCDCGAKATRSDEIRQAPAVVWTGPIGQRYRDKDKSDYHKPDGMDVYTRKTPDGKPKLLHLDNWSDVKRHCANEGLVDPREMGRNMTVGEDGKTFKADMGAPGTEV